MVNNPRTYKRNQKYKGGRQSIIIHRKGGVEMSEYHDFEGRALEQGKENSGSSQGSGSSKKYYSERVEEILDDKRKEEK